MSSVSDEDVATGTRGASARLGWALATEPIGPLPPGMDAAELAAWTAVANVLMNLDSVLSKG